MENELVKYLVYSPDRPMFFTSGIFWVFLALVMLLYNLVYKRPVLRHAYLLIVSLYFYYQAGGWFFLMLIFSTLADYYIGIRIHGANTFRKKKFFLVISIIINLGILAYFKYSYFLADIISCISGTEQQVTNIFAALLNRTAGSSYDIHTIILPIGVSFYTFQTMSYTLDVYRGQVKPVRSIIDFGFYVSFFPQLVAGPIVRASEFIPQLYQKYNLTERQFWHAVFLIMGGLVKKILVADYLAVGLIDKVFESPGNFTGFENLLSVYAYAIQIFFDFSGYTDIAIGVALLMGFRLPLNFSSPYRAVSLTDFWRRWHISLSRWLRDYLYIPLGGSRKGKVRTSLNIMITMLLGGLWHGADLRFVIWGLYHGLLLVIEKLTGWEKVKAGSTNRWGIFAGRMLTFHLVLAGWLIFRAGTPAVALDITGQIFGNFQAGSIIQFIRADLIIVLMIAFSYVFISLPPDIMENVRGWFILRPYWIKILIVAAIIILIFEFQAPELKPFIYFRF